MPLSLLRRPSRPSPTGPAPRRRRSADGQWARQRCPSHCMSNGSRIESAVSSRSETVRVDVQDYAWQRAVSATPRVWMSRSHSPSARPARAGTHVRPRAHRTAYPATPPRRSPCWIPVGSCRGLHNRSTPTGRAMQHEESGATLSEQGGPDSGVIECSIAFWLPCGPMNFLHVEDEEWIRTVCSAGSGTWFTPPATHWTEWGLTRPPAWLIVRCGRRLGSMVVPA